MLSRLNENSYTTSVGNGKCVIFKLDSQSLTFLTSKPIKSKEIIEKKNFGTKVACSHNCKRFGR